jgi:hypothetical protein
VCVRERMPGSQGTLPITLGSMALGVRFREPFHEKYDYEITGSPHTSTGSRMKPFINEMFHENQLHL